MGQRFNAIWRYLIYLDRNDVSIKRSSWRSPVKNSSEDLTRISFLRLSVEFGSRDFRHVDWLGVEFDDFALAIFGDDVESVEGAW
jgi:hypothetical protein